MPRTGALFGTVALPFGKSKVGREPHRRRGNVYTSDRNTASRGWKKRERGNVAAPVMNRFRLGLGTLWLQSALAASAAFIGPLVPESFIL